MRNLAALLSVSLLLSCADSSSPPTAAPDLASRCGALREHLVALRLDGVGVDREQHLRAQRDALGAGFVADCARTYLEPALACALAAKDAIAVSDCLAPEVP